MRQTDFTQVMEDRTGAGVAASLSNQSPNGCLGQQSPHLARMGQQFAGGVTEQKAIYVGMDVAKAQVDVAVRPTDDRWEVPHDQKGIRKLVSQLQALDPAMVLLEATGVGRLQSPFLPAHGEPVEPSVASMGILRQVQDEQKPIGDVTLQSSWLRVDWN